MIKKIIRILVVSYCAFVTSNTYAAADVTSRLVDYDKNPPKIKHLIKEGITLSKRKLTYIFGSANPRRGGMDCSGVIYYLLKHDHKTIVPRDANGMFNWLLHEKKIHYVNSHNIYSSQFNALKPGDLLFWSGTYKTNKPISHVMMYIGKTKDGKKLAFGSTTGKGIDNKIIRGVNVFKLHLPKLTAHAKFIGYGHIPIINC